uniref:Ig-like domain-containing protein n=1 Tax=Maylandia zebra TaxID=106582 RepID=A0A3P9DA68_9CICH
QFARGPLMLVLLLVFIELETGNVTLPCRARNNSKILTVEWHRPDLQPKYVLLFRDGNIDPDNQHQSFKNRVDLQDRKMKDGNVSLILKNVTINDSGTYECQVFLEETRSLQKRANLSGDPITASWLLMFVCKDQIWLLIYCNIVHYY